MRSSTRFWASLSWLALMAVTGVAQSPPETIDMEMINKIKEEGMERSQVMDTISYLTDVYGPRLTGSPMTKVAGEWTVKHMTEWGLEDAHLEPWGPFGRGWTLEGSTINMVSPSFAPLIAYPKAWSPSTPQKIRGEVVYLDVKTAEDLEKYRGKLNKAIVLISPPRELKAWFEPPAVRKTEEELLALANAELPAARGARGGFGGFRRPPTPPAPPEPAAAKSEDGAKPDAEKPAAPPAPPARSRFSSMSEARAAQQLQADKWEMAFYEGAAVVLEPGRGDGGTVFVASVTMPRNSATAASEGGRSLRPWGPDVPNLMPQAVMAAEHYNRLVRMVERGVTPELEIDITSKFYDDDSNTFNVIAEIPGTDLKDEIVMLGGHFDSWHAGTGATDNAIGCGVALEAVRILKAIDAKPRRTIRIALWTGEEQGLYGSRAYVAEHFGKTATVSDDGEEGGRRQRPRTVYELTPEHEKISAYFNLDNGTGKVRGIHLQGNEALRSVFRTWLTPFAEMGASTITAGNTGGTDHLSFDGIGIPGFQFIQDPVEYDTRTHHSSMDVYERIQVEDAKQASIIMASFVYNTAMRDEKLTRKPLNGEIVMVGEETEKKVELPAAAAAVKVEATLQTAP